MQVRTGQTVPIIVIQEAGLDGFWIHRLLQDKRVESHVVDPASIATSRRRRRAKTDKIDEEALVRALLAYKRGEPRICAMVRAPTPQEEDRRRICRERKTLTAERIEQNGGRVRKVLIVALARKLLIAFWKYVTAGVVLEGAETRAPEINEIGRAHV